VVKVRDKGEPGKNDTIGVTVNGSPCPGTAGEMKIRSGNIEVK
jgi:hypothetical protein